MDLIRVTEKSTTEFSSINSKEHHFLNYELSKYVNKPFNIINHWPSNACMYCVIFIIFNWSVAIATDPYVLTVYFVCRTFIVVTDHLSLRIVLFEIRIRIDVL